MRSFLPFGAIIAAVAAGPGLAAQVRPPAATSHYTALDLDRCRRDRAVTEGDSAQWRCAGHAGVPLIVMAGDGRFDIDAGEDNGVWESAAAFNTPGPRVEWRVRRGLRPHAIIYRLRLTGDGNDGRTMLGVETVTYLPTGRGGEGWVGCLVAWVHGDVHDASAVARRIADRMDRRFQCGHTEPEEIRAGR